MALLMHLYSSVHLIYMLDVAKIDINSETTKLKQKKQYISIKMTIEEQNATGTDE